MHEFWKCLIYLAAISVFLFLLGRLVPKKWLDYTRFPFRAFPFEKEGRIYTRLGVQKWKDGMPDMGVLLPWLVPTKKLSFSMSASAMERMVWETCLAEWVHELLSVLGFGCVWIWKGMGGWTFSILYALGNMPYIIIQRYNRPTLIRLMNRLRQREAAHLQTGGCLKEGKAFCAVHSCEA